MKREDIRSQIENLWIETFGDSSEYVKLLFDNYYNRAYIGYASDGKNIVSAMLGISCEFNFRNQKSKLQGLYLCGLMTIPEMRKHGVMSTLIEMVNTEAENHGFDFTFLIPSNEKNRCYYSKHDYENSRFVNYREYIVSENSFSEFCDYECGEDVKFNVRCLGVKDDELKCKTREYLYAYRVDRSLTEINHTKKDIDVIFEECFISGEKIFVITDRDEKVEGVMFCECEGDKTIIKFLACDEDVTLKMAFLREVVKTCNTNKLILHEFCCENRVDFLEDHVLFPLGFCKMQAKCEESPYGMVRKIPKNENLKFQEKERSDLEFSILVPDGNNGREEVREKYNRREFSTLDENCRYEASDTIIYRMLD